MHEISPPTKKLVCGELSVALLKKLARKEYLSTGQPKMFLPSHLTLDTLFLQLPEVEGINIFVQQVLAKILLNFSFQIRNLSFFVNIVCPRFIVISCYGCPLLFVLVIFFSSCFKVLANVFIIRLVFKKLNVNSRIKHRSNTVDRL